MIAVGLIFAFLSGTMPQGLGIVAFVFSVIALAAAILAMSMRYYSYLFGPMLRMKGGSVVLDASDAFYLSQNGNAVIVRGDDAVYATSFIKVPVYSSATEMSDEQSYNFANLFSRIVSLSKTPIRITSQLYSINKDDYLARINTRLAEAENKYSILQAQKGAKKPDLDRIKGEVTMWHNMLDSVSKANSQALEVYAQVTVSGGTEDEALNLIALKTDEISSGISAALGVSASVVSGTEALVLLEPEYMIPPTTTTELMRYAQAEKGM
jgi:hypothetical protein